jgi:hypothetical protein
MFSKVYFQTKCTMGTVLALSEVKKIHYFCKKEMTCARTNIVSQTLFFSLNNSKSETNISHELT